MTVQYQMPFRKLDSGEGKRGASPTRPQEIFTNVSIRYIKQAAVRLRDDFDSDVPKTVDELCSLPGVGPKMAFLCLQSAWQMYVCDWMLNNVYSHF